MGVEALKVVAQLSLAFFVRTKCEVDNTRCVDELCSTFMQRPYEAEVLMFAQIYCHYAVPLQYQLDSV